MGAAESTARRRPPDGSLSSSALDDSEREPLATGLPEIDIAETTPWRSSQVVDNRNGHVVDFDIEEANEIEEEEKTDEEEKVSEGIRDVPEDDEGTETMRILVLMSETGGGHRASAEALKAAFSEEKPGEIQVMIVDFWVNIAGFPFHGFPQQYAYVAKRPMLWYFLYIWAKFPPTRWLTEMVFSLFCHRKVRNHFRRLDPDVIVSVHPLVNRLSLSCLAYNRWALNKLAPAFVTVVTDLGGAHPTWFDPRADVVYVPSEPLREEAERCGLQSEKIRLFGLPIRPSFWTETRSVEELRRDLGMAQNMPAVLLVGGGDGVGGLRHIATAIAEKISKSDDNAGGQLVVICGKNKSLLTSLQKRSWPVPVVLKGFVTNMSEWMAACNVLCSKAGPGTIAEAWIRGLPTIITGYLPGQEEGNVRLVTESGAGEYSSDPERIAEIASRWVSDPELLGSMSARARALGRPNASRQIASDIRRIGRARMVEQAAFNQRVAGSMRMSSSLGSGNPSGYFAMTRYYVGSILFSMKRSLSRVFFGPSGPTYALAHARE